MKTWGFFFHPSGVQELKIRITVSGGGVVRKVLCRGKKNIFFFSRERKRENRNPWEKKKKNNIDLYGNFVIPASRAAP